MNFFKLTLLTIMLTFAAVSVAQETAPGAVTDVQALLEECQACHGPGGVSTDSDIPSLAGQSAESLATSIEQFKFYERHCPKTQYRHGDLESSSMTMCDVAGRLSKEEVAAIGRFFESQATAQ
jgi:sulfide dehydrogenase cytochrome subunit